MTITRQPESLCLTGNMASIRVATDTDITMTLTSGGDELLTHTYSPTADNIVDINLRDIITSLLSCQLSNTSSPYQQTMICRSFTVTLTDGTDTATVSFKALRAGVDNLSDTVGNFLQHNFLTWQPNVKPVTYYTPEFLTYYAQQQVVVKCLAHIAEGNETTVTLATISADTCVTVPVQYAIIAGLTNALPQWYDVWVETGGGTRLTYKQRYYAQDMRSEQEQWILFENSLGGIDTFRAYGDSDNTAEHTHNVAEIEEVSQEYRVDTERKYKKSTGRLDRNERLWLLDFFPSTRKYIYIGQSLRQIVVVESDVNYKASELPSSYTFTYRYADAKPYLNLPRTDVPLEVLDIQIPDVGSFTVAPRLVEFPATPLSDGALFPVQDPYSEEWGTTTFGAIRQIIAAMVSTAEESFAVLTHTHLNKSFLDGLSWDSIRNHFAGYFLSKTNADTAQGLITFAAGLVSNAIAWFKQGIKIGSDANSPLGIDAAGNATLNSVTAAQLIASVLKTPGFAEAVGLAGKGFGVTAGQDGRATLQTDDLIVLGRMLVNSLNVREVTYIGGVYLLTPAGSTVAAVQQLYAEDGSESDTRAWSTDSSGMTAPVVVGYRLYWLADNGTTATMNFWQQGDQAYCQTFNIEAGVHENVSNSLWWRLVVGVGTDDSDPLGDGKDYHYADVADTDIVLLFDSEGEPVTGDGGSLSFIGKGSSYAFVQNGLNSYTAPVVGDKAVCLGSQTSSNRRGAIQLNTEGEASIGIYDGINNFANLSTHEVHFLSKSEVRMSSRRFRWTTATGASTPPIIYRGDWTQGSTSYYYDEWDYNGSRWLCLYQGAEGITCAPGTVPQGDTTHSWTYYWKKISLKGDDGKSVNIAGYADYLHGVDWNGNARPQTVTETEVGLIDLLDYHSTQEDMIEVGEEGESDWQAYSVPLGTCYILKGTNHLYEATENGWLDLGKFKGEDGAPAPFYTEEWYAWSNDASTANATTSPNIGNNSWEHYIPEQGSYAYLWKKTVRWEWNSTLKIYRAGNPQYYRLSGTNGTSIAVKGHVATTSNLPATHSDGDAYVVDADGHLYMWSDEANQWLDIGQFQGENGRTYYVHIAWATNVVYSEQTGEVTRVDGFVIAKTPDDDTHYWMGVLVNENSSTDSNDALLYTWSYTKGVNGTSPWIADNYNEMDSIACDANGKPVQINGNDQSVSTVLKVWHGSTEESFSVTSVKRNNTAVTLGSKTSGVTVTWDGTNKALTVTYDGATNTQAAINGKDEYEIAISANNGNFTPTLNFTVNGVRPGADGQPATIYKIKPTVNSIAFGRDANGNLTPNEVSFYLECEKSQGGTITNPAISYVGIVRYSTSVPPADKNAGTAWGTQESGNDKLTFSGGVATVSNGATFNQIYIALFATDGTLYDRETILIVRDGAKGTDGNNGDTIKTVTVYKRSGTQPETPTGSTIPPTGWSTSVPVMCSGDFSDVTSGDYKGWRKATGDDNDGAFIKDTITFVTTSPNEVVRIAIKASSEEDYDFIFVGNLDANYASRPQDMDNISDSRKASGEESKIVSITVPTAGEHTLCVIYTKDGSSYDGMDCGWYKVINMENIVWSSMATFKNDILQGSWSTPVRWNGSDGDDGYSVTLTPSTIIINQSEELTTVGGVKDYYLDYTNATAILEVKKGGVPVDASITRSTDGTCSVPTITHQSTGRYLITMGAVNKHSGNTYVDPADGATRTRYYDKGRITINVTPNGASETTRLYLDFRCNLQGTINTIVKGDVETTVAEKITYGYNNETGSVGSLQAVGKYIRSSEKNIAQLTETVSNLSTSNGNNLFGFSKGAIFDGSVPFVQGYGMACVWNNGQAYSRVWNLDFGGKPGYYVVTCEIKAQSEANIRFFLADIPPVDGVGLTNAGNELKVAVTTQWKKITAVYNLTAADIANSNGQLVIRDGSTSNHVFIRKLQIEHGSTPSLFGICADDAANNSEPMHVTWNQSPSGGMFSDETSGNYGPGGTSKYTTNRVYPSRSPQYPEGTGYIELIKGDLMMTEGIYTLSFWAKASVNESVMECFCYDATNTETYKGVVAYCDGLGTYYGEIDPNQTEGMSYWGSTRIKLTTAWKKYYVHWYLTGASSKISVIPIRINGADTEGARIDYYIAQIKLERGYVTSANRTVYETVMKQTARRMDFSVLVNSMEKAGIHMYTESNGTPDNEAELAKGIIELNADRTIVDNELVVNCLKTSKSSSEPHVEIYGSNALFFGTNPSQANIVLSVDDNGCAQLNFYDAQGNYKYGLGPSTIFEGMEMTENAWRKFTMGIYGYYSQPYSTTAVNELASQAVGDLYQFIEGYKKIDGNIKYNVSLGVDPSVYHKKVFVTQSQPEDLDANDYAGTGYYIGWRMPATPLFERVSGRFYSREVYQINTAGGVPLPIGTFYFWIFTSGNTSTVKLADAQGNEITGDSNYNMSHYKQ